MTKGSRDVPLVQQTGGTMNIGAMAVGDHARAIVKNAAPALADEGRQELLTKLNAVLDAIDQHGHALPDKGSATQLVERIATEASQKHPDKLTLKSFLGALADEVKSVSAIVTTVTSLTGAVLAFF
jgi:hypothetical protein